MLLISKVETFYGNIQALRGVDVKVNSGEIVTHGSVIGLVGSTGISSAPHLHFEIWKGFNVLDPFIFFPEYKKTDLTFSDDKN